MSTIAHCSIDNYITKLSKHNNNAKKHFMNVTKNYTNEKILDVYVLLYHDGYNNDGPKSDLYDLNIIYLKNNMYFLDVWHREYWYNGEDNDVFLLLNTFIINCKTNDEFLNIYKNKSYFKYCSLIE